MKPDPYLLADTRTLVTPALVFYQDLILDNTRRAIRIAGGVDRLWPHVKSHKMQAMVELLQSMGINRFKCATLAEAEMTLRCQPRDLVVSYPLVGPNIGRFLELAARAGNTRLWAVGDDLEQLELLSDACLKQGLVIDLLVDVDLGMNRTGVPLDEVEAFYRACQAMPGLQTGGLHCYDGHHTDRDFESRLEKVKVADDRIRAVRDSLEAEGCPCGCIIAGGTPSFPCHAVASDFYLSPGTLFLSDYGSSQGMPDLGFTPAACLITRVISRPGRGLFTLDLGSKAIATDPVTVKGIIAGMEDKADPLFQSEEHWTFKMRPGHEDDLPAIGSFHYVIPTHICPTTALYPEVLVARDGVITGSWPVTARNRSLTL